MAITEKGIVYSISADAPATEIELPLFASPRAYWYEFAAVGGDVELVWEADETAGIIIPNGSTITKGPYSLENAPRFFYAAAPTALRVTVLAGDR